jgi:predicted O-methyltransferase YrrM
MSILSRLKTTVKVLLYGLPKNISCQEPKPIIQSRYDYLMSLYINHKPISMIEIGVWRGDRALRFINEGEHLKRYVGFDLFEEMTDEKFQSESMGNCNPHSIQAVRNRIKPIGDKCKCSVQLVAGQTEETLAKFAEENPAQFDFIYIDGGHSLQTIASDWSASKQLLKPGGLVVFDDYYLNDATRGAKPLIDKLLADKVYDVRFFPMVEDIIENIQITMVAVRSQSL